jgi:hypothetical protein
MLPDADADHQGAAGAGRDHLVRLSHVDRRQGVGALQPRHRVAQGLSSVAR